MRLAQAKPKDNEFQCTNCEDNFALCKDEEPYTDHSGQVICEECYREIYEYDCCFCGDSEDDFDGEHQHKMLVVFTDEFADHSWDPVPSGIYLITDFPYYWSDMMSGGLFRRSLERVRDVPSEYRDRDYDYPCGHLCLYCQKKMLGTPFTNA